MKGENELYIRLTHMIGMWILFFFEEIVCGFFDVMFCVSYQTVPVDGNLCILYIWLGIGILIFIEEYSIHPFIGVARGLWASTEKKYEVISKIILLAEMDEKIHKRSLGWRTDKCDLFRSSSLSLPLMQTCSQHDPTRTRSWFYRFYLHMLLT